MEENKVEMLQQVWEGSIQNEMLSNLISSKYHRRVFGNGDAVDRNDLR